MTRTPRLRPLAAALAATALLAACGGPSEAELLASARTYIEQRDHNAAIIQLKAALQANPQQAEARYLLGKALLDTGKPAEAIVELRKAAELKWDENRVVPPLARAMLSEGELRPLLATYGDRTLPDAKANADLQTTLATALAALDQRDRAEQKLAAALAADPAHGPALLLKARLAASKQDFAGALAALGELTARDPGNADAWLLQAEIQHLGTRDTAAALASYRKAVEARPKLMAAHQGLVALLVAQGDTAAAQAHVDELKKAAPDEPVTKLLDAQMAFLRKDYAATRAIAQPLLQLAPNNALLLQLAGAAEFHLRSLAQAENLLAQAVKLAPEMPMARMLLVQTYLRTGQPEKALDTVKPALEARPPRAEAFSLAGEAYLQAGDPARAEQMFQRATQIRPDDTRARTALALGQIGRGNASAGLAELEALAAADPGTTADLALIASHLRRRDIDQALKAIDALERKQPELPLAANLRGRVLMLRNDAAGARQSFERALQLDPVYFPAVASLAALDLAEKKPEASRKRFEDLLAAQPKNHRAMLALAALAQRTGAPPAEATRWLEAAVQAAPDEASPRLQLVNHLLATGNPKGALSVAQQAAAALPASRELLQALGRTQLATEDWQQAVTSFNKLASMQPNAVAAPLGLADAYFGQKDYAAAERSLKRALEITPDLLQAQRALVSMWAGDGRYTEALAMAKTVQKQRPAEAAGWLMEGDIERQRRGWDAALAAYRAALPKTQGPEAAVRIHGTLAAAGRTDEAERFAANWVKDKPKDAGFRFYLGDQALQRQDWAQAEARYREVLALQPQNPLALNNVAWLMVKQGKPGALPYAEQATALAPNQPQLMDTLAVALAASNQLPKALELQQKTVEQSPDDPTLRLTLARLYIQSGDKPRARTELERLQQLGKRFADHAEVAELLKTV